MTDSEVLQKIEEIVRDELDDDSISLTMTTRASDIDGWDSLAHVVIMVAVERQFDVQFKSSEITTLKDIGNLVQLVQSAR